MDGPDFDPADLSSKREWVKIGSGSFGNVYKATLLGTTVAVKEIGNSRPDRVAGLRRDMFYLRRFPHPNVVQVFGAFEEKGVLYMVMEHLAHSLRSKSVVRKVDLVRVLADVARALTRLHAAGHVHRDVKARNVLVARGPGYGAKLCDFGLARALPSAARPEVRGDLTPRIGPPKYRAPEVRDGEAYDQSSDVYGFGVMCQQLVGQCREAREDGERERERAKARAGGEAGVAAERLSEGKASKRDKKKDKDKASEKVHSEEDLEFIQQLGALCASETPSRRPTAAACLSRCLQRLGRRMALCSAETARARVATWTDARMDVGTGGKKAKEAREKAGGARSGSAPESESEGGESRERGGQRLDGGAGSVEARGGERAVPPRRRRERDGSGSDSDSDSESVGAETPRRPRCPQEQATSRDTPRGGKRRKT